MAWRERVRSGIADIPPYSAGLTDDELKHKYGLEHIVKLNANENALGPSPLAMKVVADEMASLHHYPDLSSQLLRDAIGRFHGVTPDHVLIGNGSNNIIKLVSETFLGPDDEIVVPYPSFSQYGFGAAVMGARVVQVPLGPDFSYDVEAIVDAMTPNTKLVYVCSPNNPTGGVMTQAEVEWLLSRLPVDVVLILDLAYNDYSFNPQRVKETDTLLLDSRVVCMHTFSKLYGLAGLRVGYALAHPDLWSFVKKVSEPFNVNRVAQRAAARALDDEAHRQASRDLAKRSATFYADAFDRMSFAHYPAEGNFVLVKTGDGRATMQALMRQGVMVRTGFAGLDEYVRITFGTDEENELCVKALAQTMG